MPDVSIYLNNLWLFHNNSFFISIFRWIGWTLVKGLAWLAAACAKVYDMAFTFIDFTSYAGVEDFLDSMWPAVSYTHL